MNTRFVGALLGWAIILIFLLAVVWLLGGFIAWDMNPTNWTPVTRALLGGTYGYALVAISRQLIEYLNEE